MSIPLILLKFKMHISVELLTWIGVRDCVWTNSHRFNWSILASLMLIKSVPGFAPVAEAAANLRILAIDSVLFAHGHHKVEPRAL